MHLIQAHTAIILLMSISNLYILDASDKIAPPIPLPNDPRTVVLHLEHNWGLGSKKEPMNQALIQILADGTIIAKKDIHNQETLAGKMRHNELQELLHYVCYKQNFFKHDSESLREAVTGEEKKLKEPKALVEYNTTEIRVQLADKNKTVSVYGLDYNATKYPHLKGLQDLNRIQKHLHQLHARTLIGNENTLNELLNEVNVHVQQKYKAAPKLELKDLSSARILPDDKILVTFVRKLSDKNPNAILSATLNQAIKGKPNYIRVHYRPMK